MKTLSFLPLSLKKCILREDRIDIWQFPLTTLPLNAFSLLHETEQARAQRFYFEKHQRRFIIARAQLRFLLGLYLEKDPKEIVFAFGSHGKPYVPGTTIQFNLSHSREMALLAIGQSHPMGIDIEFFSGRPYTGIAKHVFSAEENIALAALHTSTKPLGFFHVWAQKEALIKANGWGLSYPLATTSLPILPPMVGRVYDTLLQKTWELISFMPEVACCAALCFANEVQTLRKTTLSTAALLHA